MKHIRHIALAGILAVASVMGQVLYENDFSKERSAGIVMPEKGDVSYVQLADGKKVLKFESPEVAKGMFVARMPYDFSKYRGKSVRLSCNVKYEGVSKPDQHWNGVKLMAVIPCASGHVSYRNPADGLYGTSDWVELSTTFRVDGDAQKGFLCVGLQGCKGTVWFDDIKFEVFDYQKLFPRYAPKDYQAVYTEIVTGRKRYRGTMSPSRFTKTTLDKDLPDLRSWGANLIRWQLIRNWHKANDNQDPEEYLAWVRARIPETKKVLDKAQELGMMVVVDLHVAPGGRNNGGIMNMFDNDVFADTFEKAWISLATALKGHPAIYAYDLINEPTQAKKPSKYDYLGLQFRVAKTVRAIDPVTPILIESNEWDSPTAFEYLSPIPLENIIYQAHMYSPGAYTHQNVAKRPPAKHAYPNSEKKWDKEFLRRALQNVREFQLRHGARIYIGEFSAARWAEGAELYLRDCIELFEEYGWDWSYHAFRESTTWCVEHVAAPRNERPVRAKEDTPRKKALLKGFKLNEW